MNKFDIAKTEKLHGLIWGDITHRFCNVPMSEKDAKELSDTIYDRIEEQLRQARIDENEKALRYHDSLGAEEYFSGYYLENRIKELEKL